MRVVSFASLGEFAGTRVSSVERGLDLALKCSDSNLRGCCSEWLSWNCLWSWLASCSLGRVLAQLVMRQLAPRSLYRARLTRCELLSPPRCSLALLPRSTGASSTPKDTEEEPWKEWLPSHRRVGHGDLD